MGEWIRCTGCQLLHTRRPDGRCPRCGAWTGAPEPGAVQPLATALVNPADELGLASPGAPVRPPPRVWTVFLAFLLSQAGAFAAGIVITVAVAAQSGFRTGARMSPAAVQRAVTEPGVFLVLLGAGAAVAGAVALVAAGLGREPLRSRLSLARPRGAGRAGALACAGGVGLALIFDALTSALRVRPSGPSELISRAISASSGPGGQALRLLVLSLVVAAVVAPLGEELLFRGYMQRRLVQRWGPAAGVLVTAALFGLIHMDKLQTPFALALGVMLGWIAVRSGSILPALLAHAAVNAWAVVESHLRLSPHTPAACALVAALGVALLAGSVWLLRGRPGAGARAGEAPPPAPLSPA